MITVVTETRVFYTNHHLLFLFLLLLLLFLFLLLLLFLLLFVLLLPLLRLSVRQVNSDQELCYCRCFINVDYCFLVYSATISQLSYVTWSLSSICNTMPGHRRGMKFSINM
jgi:hypothetical protein